VIPAICVSIRPHTSAYGSIRHACDSTLFVASCAGVMPKSCSRFF
jgi:hypothetical protein